MEIICTLVVVVCVRVIGRGRIPHQGLGYYATLEIMWRQSMHLSDPCWLVAIFDCPVTTYMLQQFRYIIFILGCSLSYRFIVFAALVIYVLYLDWGHCRTPETVYGRFNPPFVWIYRAIKLSSTTQYWTCARVCLCALCMCIYIIIFYMSQIHQNNSQI